MDRPFRGRSRGIDAVSVDVYTDGGRAGLGCQATCDATGSAAYFEHSTARIDTEQTEPFTGFGQGDPARLPKILVVRLTPHVGLDPRRQMAVMRVVEIDVLAHAGQNLTPAPAETRKSWL